MAFSRSMEHTFEEMPLFIIDGMQWLGLNHDEGPFYQMKRMDRYREVIAQMLEAGTAYHCYCTPDEVEAMRERQRAAGDKPRYDGTWRPEPGKTLPAIPAGIKPVVRFRNPVDGEVSWEDAVKGTITISNRELDDLVIARPDGTPTYNFCVVVDDWDMKITHVIRGDDHVNNTPRQINILKALGGTLPVYGHVPMILGADGEKLSKRHGATAVDDYRDTLGYLPEAMINYLQAVGIKAKLNFMQYAAMRDLARSGKVAIAHQTWGSNLINDTSASTPVYFGGGGDDLTKDPEVIKLLDKADHTIDPKERKETYNKALVMISEKAYAVPLWTLPVYYVANKDVKFTPYHDELVRFWEMGWK